MRRAMLLVLIVLGVVCLTSSAALAEIDSLASIQVKLQRMGYAPGVADGMMGPQTDRAIKNFQRDNQLPLTGKVDDRTMQLLDQRLAEQKPGASSKAKPLSNRAILKLQWKLVDFGYSPGRPDGYTGERTRMAIRQFQRDYKLPVTGLFDAQTRDLLNSGKK